MVCVSKCYSVRVAATVTRGGVWRWDGKMGGGVLEFVALSMRTALQLGSGSSSKSKS